MVNIHPTSCGFRTLNLRARGGGGGGGNVNELYIELGLDPDDDRGEVDAEEIGVVSLRSVCDLDEALAKLSAWYRIWRLEAGPRTSDPEKNLLSLAPSFAAKRGDRGGMKELRSNGGGLCPGRGEAGSEGICGISWRTASSGWRDGWTWGRLGARSSSGGCIVLSSI